MGDDEATGQSMSWWSMWRGRSACTTASEPSAAKTESARSVLQEAEAALSSGNADGACALLARAVAAAPLDYALMLEAAALYRSLGEIPLALQSLEGALLTSPEPATVHLEIAKLLKQQRDVTSAIDALTLATTLDESLGDAWLLLGEMLGRLDRFDESADALAHAVQCVPQAMKAKAWYAYGQALHASGKFEEAGGAYESCLSIEPDVPDVLIAAGNVALLLERDDEALAFLERACAVVRRPSVELVSQIAAASQHVGRWDEARRRYEEALALVPNDSRAKWQLSQFDLTTCNWERGWKAYGTRFAAGASPYRPLPFKTWRGELAPNDTLLILADQGLGDEIMFASCLPDALRSVGHAIIECEPRLAALFGRSFPGATVVPSDRAVDGRWLRDLPEPQWQIFGGDLCALFRRRDADFPRHSGYLKADRGRVAHWKARLDAELGPGLKVGLSWRGGMDRTRMRSRSMAPEDWRPILGVPGCRFVNLQYGDYSGELAAFRELYGPIVHDFPEALSDYDETAALVTALDLVTTVCTSIVHLTGALGRPVWVLVPFSPGWRYTADRPTMPWYPTSRLFRQTHMGDWSAPCHELSRQIENLTQLVSSSRD